ncbi:hypothetical protein BDZ94DRAFT_1266627 [Collybia nuda]|uniref:DUF6699 domain-containing protein n=1 Tax=Collybia nuda TaxID=64659 RepID=A0A9P5Y011_9AGAR|nr:hypothetical protein BDZ94DRAFT_1266627 [Collybia nuda]
MARNVHFAPANVLYSPASTPSPSHSVLSLPSSTELATPPPVMTPLFRPHPSFQLKRSPSPESSSDEMHIHFILAFIPYGAPAVRYDVSLPPSTLEDQLTGDVFAEPATHPPLPSLSIVCSFLPKRWHIEVTSWSRPGAPVTVRDVFKSIYHELRTPVSPTEYNDLRLYEDTEDVDAAYFHRCGRIENYRDRREEELKGVKRIDFLRGRNRFLGLSGTLKGNDVWELNVS